MSELDNIIADVSFLFELYRHSEDPMVAPIIEDIDEIRRELLAKYEEIWSDLHDRQRPQ
ncbi:MAG: hypothetical protein L3J02_06875 [Henriciella sp.]|nr:hypothetical protein [Henriciella sp.]